MLIKEGDCLMGGVWKTRQHTMETWYAELIDDPGRAAETLGRDYAPYVEKLGKLRGAVLDVGGGAGLAGCFLPADTTYVVIDPSPIWWSEAWGTVSQKIGRAGASPLFVRGIGETLPFGNQTFDATIAFWSLNHAQSPEDCIAEVHRVTKPGGRAIFVLEDMEPSWADAG